MKVQKFIPSSRIDALVNNTSKSIGASCNVFQVQDNISSIAEGHAWSYQVLAYQGAPSIDFSQLRPKNSKLGTGGVSSGSVSFMQPFDAIVSTMRREEKKNGAGIAFLDYSHPDLPEFLDVSFKSAYKGVYLPPANTQEAVEFLKNRELVKKLAKAYNEFNCFLVKRPLPINGEQMFVNLCTEVEIPSKGTCVLGAFNLAAYATLEEFTSDFADDFRDATVKMLEYFNLSLLAARHTPLACSSPLNRQFGLGVLGLASVLGDFGITYSELGDVLANAFDFGNDDLATAYFWLRDSQNQTPAVKFTTALIEGYLSASAIASPYVRAAFCIQPTVSTAQRTFDSRGYHVSPEIQPVNGLKHPTGVKTIVKSALKGDNVINYSPNTYTLDEVAYEDYAKVSNGFQRILDATGLGHRHSHCFYGQSFTSKHLIRYYTNTNYNRIKSLYYRLPNKVNTESLRKDELWQSVSANEIADDDVISACQMFTLDSICECTM